MAQAISRCSEETVVPVGGGAPPIRSPEVEIVLLPTHPDQLSDRELDSWIRGIVRSRVPEGPSLDYKRYLEIGHPGKNRELAKDAASFANDVGGVVVFGVPEEATPTSTPIPAEPFGLDPVPNLVESIENILLSTITPTLPTFRIREVPLSDYPGKVCYLLWVPESWAGPHMVQGYQDGRYYRRGQFRAVVMSERDVESRYRRRLQIGHSAQEFLGSQEATHLRALFGTPRTIPIASLTVVPRLLVANRVRFTDPEFQNWAKQNSPLGNPWVPSMYGARTTIESRLEHQEVELHRNGAVVMYRYASVLDPNEVPPVIMESHEAHHVRIACDLIGSFYKAVALSGSLAIRLAIECPVGDRLHLMTDLERNWLKLEPAGTSIAIHIEPDAKDLISNPAIVVGDLMEETRLAFGQW